MTHIAVKLIAELELSYLQHYHTNDMNDFEDDDKKVGTNYLLVTNLP